MRKTLIFFVSLPLLALAVALIPLGALTGLFAAPIWLLLGAINYLRGGEFDLRGLLFAPFIGVAMYLETTGFCPRLHSKLENL